MVRAQKHEISMTARAHLSVADADPCILDKKDQLACNLCSSSAAAEAGAAVVLSYPSTGLFCSTHDSLIIHEVLISFPVNSYHARV